MLSDVLAALQEVKSQLQDQLALQPGYRALLILDRAASQLGAVFDRESEAFFFSEYARVQSSDPLDAAIRSGRREIRANRRPATSPLLSRRKRIATMPGRIRTIRKRPI